MTADLTPVRWDARTRAVRLLDQTLLPGEVAWLDCGRVDVLAEAIRSLRVRGAPALGVAGGYGVVLGLVTGWSADAAAACLGAQRPTAVNLGAAARRVAAAAHPLAEARAVDAEAVAACLAMGRHGATLLAGPDRRLLTHCNTGMLACQGIGSAFGVARVLHEDGRLAQLWVDETRPLLQGARLTAFEAAGLGMPHAVLPDGAAGSLLARGQVDAVVVGADRIAANGDTANKVGTLMLAVAARHHGVPLYVVAPTSTVDLATPDGGGIPIEQRAAAEVLPGRGSPVYNPSFDVTPAALVTAIVTEHGVATAPYTASLAAMCAAGAVPMAAVD